VLVFCEREDNSDLVPVLIYDVLLNRTHGISSYHCCILTMI
jgi:hypothetical protein